MIKTGPGLRSETRAEARPLSAARVAASLRADAILARAVRAAAALRAFDQARTDAVVRAVHLRALAERTRLARLAVEETGLGVLRDKIVKNFIAAELVYEDLRGQRTAGVISEDPRSGLIEIAQPLGPILGFVPITNPTSTTIFKALIALKTRNPLIVCPPMAARRSVTAAVEACREAAVAAGAPGDCLQVVDKPTAEATEEIMAHPSLALILVTGKESLVRRAQMSGTPTIGVGPGNVPVYIGTTADLPAAVGKIISSKTFDNGSVCASEQAVVVKQANAAAVIEEFERQGAHFLPPEDADRVGRIAFDRGRGTMTATVVGQPVDRIAAQAGISIPAGTVLLVATLEGVGPEYPLSAEILAPILAFYVEPDFDAAIRRCSEITRYGGVGHTAVVHSNSEDKIRYFSEAVDAGRILVNMPSTQGALGGLYNTLSPSFTLGCGSGGNNITTDNITARHLLNIQRVARLRPDPRWADFDPAILLDEGATPEEIERRFKRNY